MLPPIAGPAILTDRRRWPRNDAGGVAWGGHGHRREAPIRKVASTEAQAEGEAGAQAEEELRTVNAISLLTRMN